MKQSIHDQLSALSINPGQFAFDGKIHRFNVDSNDHKKSGWILGHQNFTVKSGEMFQVAVVGNFKTGETLTLHSGADNLSQADKANVRKQVEKAKRLEMKMRAENQERVSEEIEKKWADLREFGVSEYLRRKRLTEINGLGVKYDGEGSVYVPARDATGKLWSWQKIQADGGKWFHPGGRIDGSFHTIGNPDTAEKIYICEGFATGASIYHATGCAVVVAFTAHNLKKVTSIINKLYTETQVVICGDDDRWTVNADGVTFNPGKEKALETGKQFFMEVVFPKFADLSSQPTDFNDLHVLEGIDAVRKQLVKIRVVERFTVYALGCAGDEFYFTSSHNKQVVRIRSFSEDSFLKLMPLAYWENEFPGRTEHQRVDWSAAKDALMTQCLKRGAFSTDLIRGSGVWTDEGRVVVNMGDHLVVDGERMGLQTINSKYIYELSRSIKPLHGDPMGWEEARKLSEVCCGFKWTNPDSGLLLTGILTLARICGALPIRPHAWITGGASTGKSSLLENLVRPMLGDNSIFAQSGTTEAGLRQFMKSNAYPVIFDEFETNGRRSDENIKSCIELMRASWSNGDALIFKGSAGGQPQQYQACFSAIVSSIRTSLVNDADKGRFAILELGPHGSDQSHWAELCNKMAYIDEAYADRFFSRIVKMIPTILDNYKVFKKSFAKMHGARFGDQYGMIMAGYAASICDDVLTTEDADLILSHMFLNRSDKEENLEDHNEALEHLLTCMITVQESEKRSEWLVGDLIRDCLLERDHIERDNPQSFGPKVRPTQAERLAALQNIGIGIPQRLEYVAIRATNHTSLAKLWRGSKWADNWSTPLKRITGADAGNARIGGKVGYSVKIPREAFLSEK